MLVESEVNVVKLSRGQEFVRFEIQKGSAVATRHDNTGRSGLFSVDDAREETLILMADGWTISAAG